MYIAIYNLYATHTILDFEVLLGYSMTETELKCLGHALTQDQIKAVEIMLSLSLKQRVEVAALFFTPQINFEEKLASQPEIVLYTDYRP